LATVEEVKKTVGEQMLDMFESYIETDDGEFVVEVGSSAAIIDVVEGFGEGGTVILVNAPVLIGAKVSPALFKWIATEGQDFLLGAMSVDVDEDDDGKTGSVIFRSNIIGDDVDPSELKAAIFSVLAVADKFDSLLQKKFGGKRYIDLSDAP